MDYYVRDTIMTTRGKQFRALALAGVLALGSCTVWYIVCMSVAMTLDTYCPDWFRDGPQGKSLVILRDGTPLIRSVEDVKERDGGNDDEDDVHAMHTSYCTLEGNHTMHTSYCTLEGNHIEPTNTDEALFARLPLAGRSWAQTPWLERLPSWGVDVQRVDRDHEYPIAWFLVQKGTRHSSYFAGYDKETRRPIGYIGRNGFRADVPSEDDHFLMQDTLARSCDYDSQMYATVGRDSLTDGDSDPKMWKSGEGFSKWMLYYLVDDGLLRVDVKERTAELISKNEHLVSAMMALKNPTAIPPTTAQEIRRQMPVAKVILLRMADRVVVLDCNGNTLYTYALPEAVRKAPFVDFLQLPDHRVLIRRQHASTDETELYWIDPDSQIARHERVALPGQGHHASTREIVLASCMMPFPALVGVGIVIAAFADAPEESATPGDNLKKAWDEYWPMSIIPCLWGVVMALLCCYRQRKFGMPGTWMWTVFVLLFGLPAYLGYRFHRPWPARLPCPSCGRRVPRDRVACCECSGAFPAPTQTGTEVFA